MSDINQKKSNRGGARAGAGRPRGSTERVSVDQILATLEAYSGQTYAELLARDFGEAYQAQDRNVIIKYHNLILNKVAPSLQAVEVTDSADAVASRAQAFQEALAKLVKPDSGAK
jgi:hypothetical protein